MPSSIDDDNNDDHDNEKGASIDENGRGNDGVAMDRTRDDDNVRDNQLKRGDRDGGDDGGGNDCEDEDDAFDDANAHSRAPGESRVIDRSARAIMEEEDDDEDPPCLDSMCGIESRRRVARMATTM